VNLRVYGASDDLVEIEGDVREEFTAAYGEPTYVVLSNGVVLGVEYGGVGEWTVSPLSVPEGADVDVRPVGWDDAANDYSETAIVESEESLSWVLGTKEASLNRYDRDDSDRNPE